MENPQMCFSIQRKLLSFYEFPKSKPGKVRNTDFFKSMLKNDKLIEIIEI